MHVIIFVRDLGESYMKSCLIHTQEFWIIHGAYQAAVLLQVCVCVCMCVYIYTYMHAYVCICSHYTVC